LAFSVNEFSLRGALISAGTTALTGGLILIALAAVVSELKRFGETLRARPTARPARSSTEIPEPGVALDSAAAAPPRGRFSRSAVRRLISLPLSFHPAQTSARRRSNGNARPPSPRQKSSDCFRHAGALRRVSFQTATAMSSVSPSLPESRLHLDGRGLLPSVIIGVEFTNPIEVVRLQLDRRCLISTASRTAIAQEEGLNAPFCYRLQRAIGARSRIPDCIFGASTSRFSRSNSIATFAAEDCLGGHSYRGASPDCRCPVAD
jgi:hypothetical protein